MTEVFKITGEWFLPTDLEKRVYGTLSYNPQEGVDLELYGNLEGEDFFPELKNQEIILGLSSKSKKLTLYNCLMTNSGGMTLVLGEESGKPSRTYSIRYLLIGVHIYTTTDVVFNRISTEIFNLGEWIGISGFEMEYETKHSNDNEVSINYTLPQPIDFNVNNKVKGRFNFIADQSSRYLYQKKVTIAQRVELQIISEEEKNIDSLLEYTITFQNFLTLALYKSTYPLSISLNGERHKKDYGNGDTRQRNIRLYFSSRSFKLDEKPKIALEMVFDYSRIRDQFNFVIENWYSKYELLEPALNLVFEQFYNGNIFTVNSFLNLAQSAETFHARIHNHTKIPRQEYKEMKDEIFKVVSSKYHSWLKDQFNFGNNLNLHSRLTELTEKYSNKVLDKILGNKVQFVLDVRNSRNYYIHYSKDGQKKALKEGNLFYLSERLKILLVCSFLIETGLDKDVLSQSLDNVKWKLFSHLANWRESKN